MKIFEFFRRYLPLEPSFFLTVCVYALIVTLIFLSVSQIGANMRYANI